MNYYSEWDKPTAAWLRELIADGLIPDGHVDTRDIRDVTPGDLDFYTQVHLFAGIGGWSEALRIAGWPVERPIWTISCPCPPFSCAGKKKRCPGCDSEYLVPCPRRTGFFICVFCQHAWLADDRHLWPEAWRLLSVCKPESVVGEQVASEDGRTWLAGVRSSMEILAYGFGGADLCSAGVGSPNIRQRLFWSACGAERAIWLADTGCSSHERGSQPADPLSAAEENESEAQQRERGWTDAGDSSAVGGMADAQSSGRRALSEEHECDWNHAGRDQASSGAGACSEVLGLGDADSGGLEPREQAATAARLGSPAESDGGAGGLVDAEQPRLEGHAGDGDDWDQSGWVDEDAARPTAEASELGLPPAPDWNGKTYWLRCKDTDKSGRSRFRRVSIEPLIFALAARLSGVQVGLLRGAGNSINVEAAAVFIQAFKETIGD